VEKLALSHPDISFKFINNNQTKLHTSGNGNRKDMIYHIFGREITSALLEVDYNCEFFHVTGFIGKPIVTRGNRNYENYFINGRYIKSALLSKAIEEAYKSFMMQHQYPFTVLYFAFHGELLDVNVHPTKMELRFEHNQEIYKELCDALFAVLSKRDLIPSVPVTEEKEKPPVRVYEEPIPEPFEKRRLNDIKKAIAKDSPYEAKYPQHERPAMAPQRRPENPAGAFAHVGGAAVQAEAIRESVTGYAVKPEAGVQPVQSAPEASAQPAPSVPAESSKSAESTRYEEIPLEDISPSFLTADAKKRHRIIGQVFKTYWLVEYEDELFIIDQHAAHEKVLYERTMASLAKKEYTSQVLSPPIIISLDAREEEMLRKFKDQIEQLGYVVEHFGGKEYQISGVPGNLFHLDMKDLFIEMLDDFSNLSGRETPQLILEKVASMSCKAAVKGNHTLSIPEIEALIDELLTLENPYNCPHGRPTIISMSKYELEKKFKRIV
jgi:DNA mismatch repair protein MutL